MTAGEFRLVEFFLRNEGRHISREELPQQHWGIMAILLCA